MYITEANKLLIIGILTAVGYLIYVWIMNTMNEQYRVLFEQSTDGIFIADAQGNYQDVNPAGCRLLGYTKDEIIKLSIADVITEDEIKRIAPELEIGARDGYLNNHWQFKRKDQSVFIGEVIGAVLSDGRLMATIRNVTEYMHAREVITYTDNQSHLTLDHMLEGCQIIGFDWRYLYMNHAAEIHNRRPNKELLGKRYMDMWPGIEETSVFNIIKDTLENKISHHIENNFIFPTGEQGWFDLSIQPVPEGVFILSIDITERKIAENHLRESEEKYRLVSENADDWIYWVCPKGQFKYISPACEWITGYKPEEFIVNPSLYLKIVVDLDREMVHHHNMLKPEEQIIPHSLKFRIINKKGDLCWIDHSCTPIFADGEYKGLIGTNRNITDIKLAEVKLFESELKFRKIFEEGPLGMALIDHDFKTLMVNAQLCRMLAFTEKELLQRTFRDITSPEEVRNDIENMRLLTLGEISVYKNERRYIRKDLKVIWGSVTITANFSDDGKFLYHLVIIENISRRKHAEESLKKVTERLRLATNVAKIGIWDWNVDNNSLMWDDKMYEIYGIQPDEFPSVYDGWIRHIHPDDAEFCHNAVQKAIRGEKEYNIEFRVIWNDGSIHWLIAEGQVIRNENNKPIRMIGVNYEITDRKLAERELLASKAILETAIESMTDAVFISDSSGRFIQFNEAFVSFHKFKSKEECSRVFNDYPDLFEGYYSNGEPVPVEQWPIHRSLRGETSKNQELITHRKDTGESWIASYSFAPIRDSNGKIIGSVVSGRDITESKKAEEALKISEERYRNIFESAVIGIYRTTPEGKIILANPTLINLLGFDSFEDLAQRNLEEEGFENQIRRQEFRNKIEREKTVIGLESEWKTKEGKSVYVNENAKAFFDHAGNILYYEGTIEDITDRMQMEKNLRESEEKFRKAFLINPDALTITNCENGKYVLVNSGYTQIFGFTEDEVIGKSSPELNMWVNMEDRDRFLNEISKSGTVENFGVTLRGKNEKIVETLVSSVIIDIDGIKHTLSTTKDVTELKRAEEAIRKHEALLNDMGRIAKIGGWEFDIGTGEVLWTKEVANIHDLDPTDSVSVDTGVNYYYGDSIEIIQKALYDAIHHAKPWDLQLEIVSAKGIHKWVRTIGNPIIKDEHVVKIIGSFQDITYQKEAEEALRKSEENLRLLMESISLPVAYISNDGEILFRNTKFIQIFGYTQEDVQTLKDWWIQAFPEDNYRKEVVKNWESFINQARSTQKDIVSEEYAITCKNGNVRIIITSGVIINSNILITLIDITDRKRAEEEIKMLNESLEKRVEERTAQLLEANKELEAFSYSVSHDLRAPLRHINGFVDLLNQKYKELLPEKGQHYLHTIVDSSNHMGTLIDDLLEFSRTGRQEMLHADIDMNMVIQNVLKLLNPDIQGRNIEWKIEQLPIIKGDQSLLRMVWHNLISNAIKFTKNKEVAIIEIGFFENDKEFSFFVKDNGAGFDMRYVHKLFGVFQRLHSKQEFEGTGIGLANVRRIIQKHGGRTWAESQEDQGAIFYFILPKTP